MSWQLTGRQLGSCSSTWRYEETEETPVTGKRDGPIQKLCVRFKWQHKSDIAQIWSASKKPHASKTPLMSSLAVAASVSCFGYQISWWKYVKVFLKSLNQSTWNDYRYWGDLPYNVHGRSQCRFHGFHPVAKANWERLGLQNVAVCCSPIGRACNIQDGSGWAFRFSI